MALKLWLSASVAALAALGTASASTAEVIRIKVDKMTFSPRQVSAHVGERRLAGYIH
jgi:hypothetical protein